MKKVLWSLGFLASVSVSTADTITLADGRVLEGKLAKGAKGIVTVTTDGAEISLPAAQVRSVAPPSTGEIYRARLRETPDTPEGHMALARWCREQGLKTEFKDQCLAALNLKADYAEAREALGYRKVAGVCMSPEDRQAMEAAAKAPALDASEGMAQEKEDGEVVEGTFIGWTEDHKNLIVEAKNKGLVNLNTRYVQVGIPMVTLELRPTLSQLEGMRTVNTSGAVTRPDGTPVSNLFIEAPIVSLRSVRTTVQVRAYPR